MPYLGQRPSKGDENNFKILDDISSYTLTFDGSDSSVVSAANDTITSLTHRFVQGQRVTYTDGDGSAIAGLTDATVYFIIKEDHNTIKLATSASNAANGTAVNITNVGSGSSHTLNVAFDGVNTKFKATHTNGVKAKITRSAQLVISINGVIQQPHDTATPSTGFGFDLDGTIVFSQAPAASDEYWAHLLTNNNVTFDISNNDVDNFTGDGSTTTFNLSKTPSDNRNVLVTIDGVVQYPSDSTTTRAYNVVENVLTFTTAPDSNVEIQVRHIGFAGSTSGGSSGGVTSFYGRTGAVVLKNTDNIVANNAEFAGNLTVQGTMTTLDTKVTEVDQLEVAANNTTVGVAITQSGSGDILNLYDGSTEVFSVADGGAVSVLATNKFLTLKKAANSNYCGLELDRDNSGTEGAVIGLAGGTGHFITSAGIHDLTIRSANGNILFGSGQTEVLRTNSSGVNVTGTLTLPDSIIHTNDTNTKIRFPAADTFTVETGGSERFRIDPNGHITIGIGASSVNNSYLTIPRYAVDGDAAHFISLRNDAAPADVTFVKSRSTTYGSYAATQDDDIIMSINSDIDTGSALSSRGTFRSIYDTSTGGVHFMWGSGASPSTTGEKMRLTATGNVGIGSVIPEQRLTVVGATDIKHYANTTINNDRLQLGFNAPEGYLKVKNSSGSPAANLALYTTDTSGNTNRTMHLRYNGDVGIGTNAPRYANSFDVFNKHSTLTQGYPLSWMVGNSSTFRGRYLCDSGGNFVWQFGSSTEEKVRFKSNGNVGIGTNNPDYGLHVYGAGDILVEDSGNGSAHLRMRSSNNGSDVSNWKIKTSSNNYLYIENDTVGGTSQFTIDDSGNVGINQDTPTADLEVVGTAGTITTLFINSATNNASIANESILKFGFNHSGTPDAVGYVKLIETSGNIFDGDMLFGVPYNDGSSGSATREAFRIRANGSLKIGTTGFNNNDIKLQLHNSGGTASQLQFTGTGTGDTSTSRGFRVGYNGSGGQLWNFESNYVRIATSNLERVNIDQYGTTQVNSIRQRSFAPNTGSTNGNYWKIGSVTLNGSEGFILTFCGTGGYSNGQQIAGTTKVVARCSNASTLVGYRTGSSIGAQLGIEDVRWKHEGSNVFSIWAKVQHYAQISPFVDFFGGALGGWTPENTNTGSTSVPASSLAFSDWEYKQMNGVNTIQYLPSETYFLQNIRMAQGKGIDFSAAADIGTGETVSNSILRDYEEGTFTPTLYYGSGTSEPSYSWRYGHYIKVGKQVTVWFNIGITNFTTTYSQVWIGGLPFQSNDPNAQWKYLNHMMGYSHPSGWGDGSNDKQIYLAIYDNASKLMLNHNGNHLSYNGSDDRDVGTGQRYSCTVTYQTD